MLAAVYIRVSDPDDPRETSLEIQADAGRAHACKLGYRTGPEHVFRDRYTGTELYDRPALSALRERVRAGAYQAVIVWKLDRLGRLAAHWTLLFEEAQRHGCQILSATEDLDNSPEGELLRNVRGYVAQVERLKTLERTQGAVRKIVAGGKPLCSGLARYGYRYDKGSRTRVIVESEAEVVRRIFTMSAAGVALRRTAQILNAEGVPCPAVARGKRYKDGRHPVWSKNTVQEILRDESYAGAPMCWFKTRATGKRVARTGRAVVERKARAEWTTLQEGSPVIVDPDTFARANTAGFGRSKGGGAPARNRRRWRLLRGLVFCGVCGRRMTTQSTAKWTKAQGRYEWYVCMSGQGERPEDHKCGNGRTPIAHADAEVWRQVAALYDRDSIRAHVEGCARPDPTLDADLAAHRHEVARGEGVIRRLVDRLGDVDDDVVAGAVRAKIEVTRHAIADHRAASAALEERLSAHRRGAEAVAAIERILDSGVDLQARAEGCLGVPLATDVREWVEQGLRDLRRAAGLDPDGLLGQEARRQILEALGVRVYLRREEVRVECAVPLAGRPDCAGGTGTTRQRFVFWLGRRRA